MASMPLLAVGAAFLFHAGKVPQAPNGSRIGAWSGCSGFVQNRAFGVGRC